MSKFHFSFITIFPEMIEQGMKAGVIGQAVESKTISFSTVTPRDFTEDRHKTVDDRPYGGGDGMVMMAEPVKRSIEACKNGTLDGVKADLPQRKSKVIYLSPQGTPLTHEKCKELSGEESLILLCGRYGGIDQRVLDECVDEEISVGDFVMSGGELPALCLADAVSRMVPGVLGHPQSSESDSFSDGLLEAALYTRPSDWNGEEVPQVLLSGDHKKIALAREAVSVITTLKKRPDIVISNQRIQSAQQWMNSQSDEELAKWAIERQTLPKA